MNNVYLIVLLVAFQFKHFVVDFPLQNNYMLGKAKESGWEKPLLAHVSVHALGTFLVTCWFGIFHALCFAIFDAAIHFVMDRFKADRSYLGRYKLLDSDTYMLATEQQRRSATYFWWAFGFDQLIHNLTYSGIIAWMMFG